MDFKSYLENILKDEEFTKWEKLYIPLNAEDVIEELPTMPIVEEMILEKASVEDKHSLQERFKRNKYEFKTQDMLTEFIEMKSRRMILVGESGAGKTTLLRWITLLYTQQAVKELISAGDILKNRIPVFIDLSLYNKKIEIEGFLSDTLKSRGLECSWEELITAFEGGKFIFLFDGLDLLGSKVKDFDPAISIQKFINKYTKNIYLLSCRKGIRYTSFPSNYKTIELLELTDEKIEEYLAHYIKDPDKKNGILNQLQQLSQFKEVCRTPLILLLIIAIFSRYKEIPSNKTQVYSRYINCLCDLFEKIGRITNVEKELINNILCELGFILQMNDETVAKKEIVLDMIARFIIKYKYEKMAKDEILKLCSQLGFLKIQNEDVKFFYQSFREYFASAKLKELFLKEVDISATFTHPKWTDVLIFLTSNLASPDANRLIQTILKADYEYRNPLFVAAKCMIGSSVGEEIKQEIIKQLLNKISDKYWYNQREAIYGLTMILGEKVESQAIESLIQKLKDEEWIRREKSAKAMGRMCEKGAIPHLKTLLEDESPAVYNAAFEAIIEIEKREKEEMKIEFKEMEGVSVSPAPEQAFPSIPPATFPQVPEGLPGQEIEIIPEKEACLVESHLVEEKKVIPAEHITIMSINLTRAIEETRIHIEETKSLVISQTFNSLLKPIIEAERGEVEETETKDEVVIARFENPNDALYSAVKMQSGIDEYNLRQPSRKVYLKIGVCSGRHGISMEKITNLANKIGEFARHGQILVVEDTYKSVHGKDKIIKFKYFGSRKLEGEENQKRGIYELLWQGEEHAAMIKESIMAIEYLEQVSAFNTTKNKPVMSKIKVARSFFERFRGLMFLKEPQPLVIEFPQSVGATAPIHTFFVNFPIDVIFLDPNFKVVDIMENIPPANVTKLNTCRFYAPQTLAKYVLELPQGTIQNTGVEMSDIVIFKEGL
ncbi:MAG: DUF192 domain-containing protein [bacterium]|nr:DUF192 domain-containing protein [bacterium]